MRKVILIFTLLLTLCEAANCATKVTGRVSDTNGIPIVGGYIYYGSRAITVTDIDGNFSFSAKNPGWYTVKYLGFISYDFYVSTDMVSVKYNIIMREDDISFIKLNYYGKENYSYSNYLALPMQG